MKVIIKDIKVIDPFKGKSYIASLIVEDGSVISILNDSSKNNSDNFDLVIDGQGKMLFPSLFDMHTHLREPGGEHKETIKTGTMAAVHGGFTKVTAFPNTNPSLDSVDAFNKLLKIIEKDAEVEVFPVPSITKGLKGDSLTDLKALKEAGAMAFTDDGKGVQSSALFIEALKKAKELDLLFLIHPEDESLTFEGVINEGELSSKLGVKGLASEAEESMIARDILLCKKFGGRLHFCHLSTSFGAYLIEAALKEGVNITAEVAPHHLCFTEDMINFLSDSDKKMNPPLRTQKDQKALIKALKEGIIKIIATDHAPHSKEEKANNINKSPFGIIGLETALPLLYHYLVEKNNVSFYTILSAFTKEPASVFGLKPWAVEVQKSADFVIFNSKKKSYIDNDFFFSKSSNFPLKDVSLNGKVEYVFYGNKIYDYSNEDLKLIKRSLKTGEEI